jgi:two-component system chemotaxis response regulator CheY
VKRILVVDNAATMRMYLRGILEVAGYAVEEAVDGMEALERSCQVAYDLFLVDVNMPRMDGYTFVRELRGNLGARQAPAVMVSTEDGTGDRTKAYQAGANFYIAKPIRPEVLLTHVRLLLGQSPS